MNMYEALQKTAAHIAENPGAYSFQVTRIPRDDETPGCILGRLAHICGITDESLGFFNADDVPPRLMGIPTGEFFRRLSGLGCVDNNDPRYVVPALRAYMEMYRAELEAHYIIPSQIVGIPREVRDIFAVSVPVAMFGGGKIYSAPASAKLKYNPNTDSMVLCTS